jgi:competence protein ComEA
MAAVSPSAPSVVTAIAAGLPPPAAPPVRFDPGTRPPCRPMTWPRAAQVASVTLLILATGLIAVYSYGSMRHGTRPLELERGTGRLYRVDLNRASRAELRNLPGVGDKLAERIDEYRRQHGDFRGVDDLLSVPGIGPATLAKLRPLVFIRDDDNNRRPISETKQVQTKTPSQQVSEPIDINRASLAELQKLPGIGPKLSQRIVDERAKRPFQSIDELRRVPGIGPKTLEKVRGHVTVD